MSLLLLLRPQADETDTLTLLPASGGAARGDTYALIATLVDEDGVPRVGVMLNFTVAGVNPQTFSDDTDALGQVLFSYQGDNVGTDTVTVEVPGTAGGTLDTWTARQTAGTSHGSYGAACSRGRLVHYIGGDTTPRRHDLYNQDTNTWSNLADTPHDCIGSAAVSVGGKVYIFGGLGQMTTVVEYDPVANTYASKTAMPRSRYRHAAVEVDGGIYLIGGYNGLTYPAEVDVYNPVSDTYATKASMPTPRSLPGAAAYDGLIYVCGGTDSVPVDSAKVEVFDPVANSWSAKADLPTARSAASVTAGDGAVWVAGGVIGGSPDPTFERLDITANTYTTLTDTPYTQQYPGYATVDGGLHVIKSTTTHYRYEAFEDIEEDETATVTWSVYGTGRLGRRTARVVP